MNEPELDELENPDNWDWENAEEVVPTQEPGAVVARRFSGAEFDRLDKAAERSAMRLTDFIREAALEKAGAVSAPSSRSGTGSGTGSDPSRKVRPRR